MSSIASRLWVAALIAGCGRVVVAPPVGIDPHPPARAGAPSARAAVRVRPTSDSSRRPYRLLWRRQTKPFVKGLSFTGDGTLVLLGSRRLVLLDARSGRQLAEREVCFTFRGALSALDRGLGALVCEEAVQLFELSRLEYRGEIKLAGRARASAMADGFAVVGFDSGPVRLYQTSDWRERGQMVVDQQLSALALAPGGKRVAMGLEHGELLEQPVGVPAPRRRSVKRGVPVRALAYGPAGRVLFAATAPLAGVWSVPALELRRTFRTVDGVVAARWLDRSTIATVGRDGLLLLDVATGSARSVGGGWAESTGELVVLAVSSGGEELCAATREGEIVCLSRGRLAGGGALPVTPKVAAAGERSTAARVTAVHGRRLSVKVLAGGALPPPATKVQLFGYRQWRVGEIDEASWEPLGRGSVWKLRGDVVYLLLDAVPAGAGEPLRYDSPVRLRWQAAAGGDAAPTPRPDGH